MNPFKKYERLVCPHCGVKIDEYFFASGKLDKVMRDLDSGAISFEVMTDCIKCGKPIYAVLWLVELNLNSKLDVIQTKM